MAGTIPVLLWGRGPGQRDGWAALLTPRDLQKQFPKSDAQDSISGDLDTPGNIFKQKL